MSNGFLVNFVQKSVNNGLVSYFLVVTIYLIPFENTLLSLLKEGKCICGMSSRVKNVKNLLCQKNNWFCCRLVWCLLDWMNKI